MFVNAYIKPHPFYLIIWAEMGGLTIMKNFEKMIKILIVFLNKLAYFISKKCNANNLMKKIHSFK